MVARVITPTKVPVRIERTAAVQAKARVANVVNVRSGHEVIEVDIKGDDPGDLTLMFDNKLI